MLALCAEYLQIGKGRVDLLFNEGYANIYKINRRNLKNLQLMGPRYKNGNIYRLMSIWTTRLW